MDACAFVTAPADCWENRNGLGHAGFPCSFFWNGDRSRPLLEWLDHPSVRMDRTAVVLSTKSSQFELSLWLDPAKGWMPERLEYTRLAPAAGPAQYARCSYTVTKASLHDGVWWPDSYRCQATIAGGKYHAPHIDVANGVETYNPNSPGSIQTVAGGTELAEISISEIKINSLGPDEIHFQASVPNGTRVSMQDAMHLHYVWMDGKIVPLTSELRSTRKPASAPLPGSAR